MKHFRPRLSRRAFWVLCALLVCLRLALTGFQQAYIWVRSIWHHSTVVRRV